MPLYKAAEASRDDIQMTRAGWMKDGEDSRGSRARYCEGELGTLLLRSKGGTYEGVVPEYITLPGPPESIDAKFSYVLFEVVGCRDRADEIRKDLYETTYPI